MNQRPDNRNHTILAALLCFAAAISSMAQSVQVVTVANATNQVTALRLDGLPNAFKVSDALYRGAQPTAEGFKQLKKLGIKTVVCLRSFHSDNKLSEGNGLAVENIPINTWDMDTDYVVKFLKIATDTNKTPVFVHCQHGADRTGTMCAVYRLAVCGWTKEAAIKEMTEGGFGFHSTWQNLITFITDINVAEIKKKAGQAAPKGVQTP